MPAYEFTYWPLDVDDVPENYRDTIGADDSYWSKVGVNAPSLKAAVECFENVHRWEFTNVRSITYIGPGVKGYKPLPRKDVA